MEHMASIWKDNTDNIKKHQYLLVLFELIRF